MEFEDRYRQGQGPKFDCLLFDLDDTLYPMSSGLAKEVLKNIGDYMVKKLGIEKEKVPALCDLLYKNYGTTMAGLRAIEYEFEYDDYHGFVHGRLPYHNLKTDPILRNLLFNMPQRKLIFTNADKNHAVKALNMLGVEDCFEGIICFETLNPSKNYEDEDEDDREINHSRNEPFDILQFSSQPSSLSQLPKTPILCKPSIDAFDEALRIANIDPQRTIFFDDSPRNILSAKRAGLHTVLVGNSVRSRGADHALKSIHNIREALPELWESEKMDETVKYPSGKVAIETPVTA
ncbi:uncharacterized protein C24B11.05 [Amborella trichopoda]|uniref:Uncharacterized protein n=1 Tax=Amborella trichopoda TaxID=13333 RepID=W1PJU0_AMBTC|nr:uncharacterized protein C24B11.05 [Amborella trichopoda]ERN07931.1 hypothetical protein AMTR_s00012p00242140 [Amborella trichopoda]|eukprot:XP_006846256.1 uncharacterized protein C24B11.05 [Amborella trichopoda]